MKNWANLHWEDLCFKVLRLLKTEDLPCWQHWDNFQFLEIECRFWPCASTTLGPDRWIVQPELLWRWEMWDVPLPGTSGTACQREWQVPPHCQPAPPPRAESLATAAPRCVLLWAESVPAKPGGFGHRGQSPVSTAKFTWLMLYLDNCNDSFPRNTISSPTWSWVRIKGHPSSGLNHHGCADFMLACITNGNLQQAPLYKWMETHGARVISGNVNKVVETFWRWLLWRQWLRIWKFTLPYSFWGPNSSVSS